MVTSVETMSLKHETIKTIGIVSFYVGMKEKMSYKYKLTRDRSNRHRRTRQRDIFLIELVLQNAGFHTIKKNIGFEGIGKQNGCITILVGKFHLTESKTSIGVRISALQRLSLFSVAR